MGVGSCWPGTWGPRAWLCKISIGLDRLGLIGVHHSSINAWGTGILEGLALLRVLS